MASILDRFRLDGQVAVITGSGRGIGAATAIAYADAGADVVISARTLSELEETAEQVRARGRRALVVTCDVLDGGQREALINQAVAEFGRLDILVNNAGGWGPKAALDTTDEEFDACLHFNVTTAFSLSRLSVPHMVATAGRGCIVNISSVAGSLPQAGFAAYGTGKAALSWLTRELAQDFAPKVRVNAIGVGATVTTALANFMDDDLERMMCAKTPLARLGLPEDIAACALYLASPAGAYITGEILGVNGGLTASQVEMPRARI
ncbi:MAG TPA: SDR family oxidoreductase [Kineobactrum sp.]